MEKDILERLQDAGFDTTKGTNAQVIGKVVEDYVEYVFEQRKKELQNQSIWSTNDLAKVAHHLYEHYRIYNNRHIPDLFEPTETTVGGVVDCYIPLFDKVLSFAAQEHQFSVNQKETIIKIPYNTLIIGSKATSNKQELKESFLNEQGVLIEQDYSILATENNYAKVVIHLKDFKSASISLFAKKEVPGIPKPLFFKGLDANTDYLRYIATNVFAKFKKFWHSDLDNIQAYINSRYNLKTYFQNKKLYVATTQFTFDQLQKYLKQNSNVKLELANRFEIHTHYKFEPGIFDNIIAERKDIEKLVRARILESLTLSGKMEDFDDIKLKIIFENESDGVFAFNGFEEHLDPLEHIHMHAIGNCDC